METEYSLNGRVKIKNTQDMVGCHTKTSKRITNIRFIFYSDGVDYISNMV